MEPLFKALNKDLCEAFQMFLFKIHSLQNKTVEKHHLKPHENSLNPDPEIPYVLNHELPMHDWIDCLG